MSYVGILSGMVGMAKMTVLAVLSIHELLPVLVFSLFLSVDVYG